MWEEGEEEVGQHTEGIQDHHIVQEERIYRSPKWYLVVVRKRFVGTNCKKGEVDLKYNLYS
jgi:hypothetical protein